MSMTFLPNGRAHQAGHPGPRIRGAGQRSAVALIASLAVGLTACSASTSGSGGDANLQPKSGGSVTVGVATEPSCFNPEFNNLADAYPMIRNVFESLISRSSDGELKPWLAESWTASPDATQYTVTLREGIMFSDGTPLDAAAVKINLDYLIDPKNGTRAGTATRNFARTEIVDQRTVRIVTSTPDATVLQLLTDMRLAMVSPKNIAAQTGNNQVCAPDKLSGTGPFLFDKYQQGQSLTVVRNPAYNWAASGAAHTGPAYLDSAVYRFLPETSVRVGALTSNQVDAIFGVPALDFARIKPNRNLQLLTGPSSGTSYNLNINPYYGPTTDIRVRQALRDGFDLDAVIASMYVGTAERAWAPLAPDNPFTDQELKGTWGNNIPAANKLLDEAGWTARDADGYRTKDGARLNVSVIFPAPGLTDNRDQLISAIAAELHQNIGLQLDLQLVTNGEYTAKAKANAWGVYPASWPGSDTSLIFRLVGPGSVLYGNSPHGGVDPQIIALNDQAAATPDVGKRTELYKQLQKIAMDQGYILPLYNPTYQIAATHKVHGLSFETRIDSPSSAYDVWTES